MGKQGYHPATATGAGRDAVVRTPPATALATPELQVATCGQLVALVRAFVLDGQSAPTAVCAVLSLLRSDDVGRRVCGAKAVETAGARRRSLACLDVCAALRVNALRDESREWHVDGVRASRSPSQQERMVGNWRDMRDEGVVAALRALRSLASDHDACDASEEAAMTALPAGLRNDDGDGYGDGVHATAQVEERAQALFLQRLRDTLLPHAGGGLPMGGLRVEKRVRYTEMGRCLAAQLLAGCSDGLVTNALLASSDVHIVSGALEGVRQDECLVKRVELLSSPSVALRRGAAASLHRVSASRLGGVQWHMVLILGASKGSNFSITTAATLLARYAHVPRATLMANTSELLRRAAGDINMDVAARWQCKLALAACQSNVEPVDAVRQCTSPPRTEAS